MTQSTGTAESEMEAVRKANDRAASGEPSKSSSKNGHTPPWHRHEDSESMPEELNGDQEPRELKSEPSPGDQRQKGLRENGNDEPEASEKEEGDVDPPTPAGPSLKERAGVALQSIASGVRSITLPYPSVSIRLQPNSKWPGLVELLNGWQESTLRRNSKFMLGIGRWAFYMAAIFQLVIGLVFRYVFEPIAHERILSVIPLMFIFFAALSAFGGLFFDYYLRDKLTNDEGELQRVPMVVVSVLYLVLNLGVAWSVAVVLAFVSVCNLFGFAGTGGFGIAVRGVLLITSALIVLASLKRFGRQLSKLSAD